MDKWKDAKRNPKKIGRRKFLTEQLFIEEIEEEMEKILNEHASKERNPDE